MSGVSAVAATMVLNASQFWASSQSAGQMCDYNACIAVQAMSQSVQPNVQSKFDVVLMWVHYCQAIVKYAL